MKTEIDINKEKCKLNLHFFYSALSTNKKKQQKEKKMLSKLDDTI